LPFTEATGLPFTEATGLPFTEATGLPFTEATAFAGFGELLRFSGLPDLAFNALDAFAGRTFRSDLADLDWGIMGYNPVCCCGLGWFFAKAGLRG
jgi:hypothetical protein